MSQIIKKFVGNDQIDGAKIHLDNNQAIRARNAANSADVNILKLDASNVVQVVGALNSSGAVTGSNLSGTNSGDVTLAAVGSAPSANGASLSGQVLTLQPADGTHPGLLSTGSQTIGGAKTFSVAPISSVDAVANNELVRFSQLSALTDGLKPKAAVVAATTTNINLASASDPNPIDGHTLANGDRVLLWQQTSAPENGIYVAVTATNPTTWVRSSDFDMPAEIPGAYTVAEFGTAYQGSVFVCLSSPGTIGTDPINFAQRAFTTGANQSLSNLTSPTAINQDLIFAKAAPILQSQDNSTGSETLTILSGAAPAGTSGQIISYTGNGASSGGQILQTGSASSGNSGSITIQSGNAASGTTGPITISVGTGATPGNLSIQPNNGSINVGDVLTATNSSGATVWATPAQSNKELFVLSGTNITNQYVDLAHVAKNNSINFAVKGAGAIIEGASYDYSVSYTGGSGGNTRITFLNDLATGGASALIAGDVIVLQYQY